MILRGFASDARDSTTSILLREFIEHTVIAPRSMSLRQSRHRSGSAIERAWSAEVPRFGTGPSVDQRVGVDLNVGRTGHSATFSLWRRDCCACCFSQQRRKW